MNRSHSQYQGRTSHVPHRCGDGPITMEIIANDDIYSPLMWEKESNVNNNNDNNGFVGGFIRGFCIVFFGGLIVLGILIVIVLAL